MPGLPGRGHAASVTDELTDLGPIDYLIVEFPENRMTGAGLAHLLGLVDRGIIRVLDLVFVRKEPDGSITVLSVADLDGDGTLDLAVFDGASSGLLSRDDIDEAGVVLRAGSTAAVLIYENLWAAPMAAALRRSGAQLVATGRIPWLDIASALDAAGS
jgi:hypothetical protein